MKKKLISALLVATMASNTMLPACAINIKQTLPLEKVFVYGTNTAGYMMDKKNKDEALTKLATYDVIWDTLGYGEEVLLNGDPNAFPKLKDDILFIKATLDAVANMATAVGEGNYDTAAYEALNLVISKINHPVVTLAWEAVKLAYESRKAVLQTKAALEIETLYGIVNQDRRIVGKQSGNAPKLISVDSETVDYFYNKYLITNDSVRALVKTYVEKELHQDFPDVSYGTSLWGALTGYSEEVEKEETLKQLEEFRNVSRGWIRALLADLNKQVELEWSQTRVRQEKAKFDKFYAQFKNCYTSVDALMSHYKALREFEVSGGKKRYEEKLKELQDKSKQVIAGADTSLESDKLNQKYSQIFAVDHEATLYAASSYSMNEDSLYSGFENISNKLTPYIVKLAKEIQRRADAQFEKNKTQVPTYSINAAPPDYKSEIQSILTTYQAAASSFDDPPDLDISSLNNISNARGQIKTLKNYLKKIEEIHEVDAEVSKKAGEIRAKIANLEKEAKKLQKQINELAKQRTDKRNSSLESAIAKLQNQYNTLKWISRKSSDALDDVMYQIGSMRSYINNKSSQASSYIGQINSAIASARKECNAALRSADFYFEKMNNYYDYTNNKTIFERDIDYAKSKYDNYTTMGPMGDSAYSFEYVSYDIKKKRWELAPQENSFMHGPVNFRPEDNYKYLYELDNLKKQWQKQAMPDVSTLRSVFTYTQEEIDQAKKYWEASSSKNDNKFEPPGIDDKVLDKYNRQVNALNSFASSYKGSNSIIMKYEQLKRKVAQDDDNRARDARFLSEMQLQWDSWMKYIANSPLNLTQTSDRKQYFSYEGKIRPYEYEGLTYARIYENNHERLASSKDIQAVSQNSEGAKYIEVLKRMPVYRFISSNMPKTKQMIDNAQNSSKLFASMEKPNFFKGQKLILEDDIKKAKLIVDSTKIDSDNYKKNLQEAAEILGLEIKFPQKEINKSNIYYVNLQSSTGSLKTLSDSLISDYKGFELGAKYVEAYEKIAKLIIDKRNSILEKDKEKQNIKEGQEKIKDWELKLTNLVNKAKIQKDYNSLDKIYQEFWALKGDYFKYDYTYYKSVSFESHLKSAEQTFIGLFAKFENKENKAKQAIADMYKSFKEAYEQKSDYGVMALISNGWESSDGTTLMDLEDNFRNMFSIYDAIIYSISNLSVEKLPNGKYIANYDIEITGKNFDMGIERKEKSSVSEEVILEKNSYRINRTLNGRFWYRE